MTDPRTEEIRARREAALSAFNAPADVSMAVVGPSDYGWGAVDPETGQTVVYSTAEEWAEMAIHAPADLAYLLDRIDAMQTTIDLDEDVVAGLEAERDRYKAVADAARESAKHGNATIAVRAALDALDTP